MDNNLLSIQNLQVEFQSSKGAAKAVSGICLDITKGETVGLVGESGCGKSVSSMSILRLIENPGKITGGKIIFNNKDLLTLSEPEIRKIRGRRISMIFQEPMTSFNPVFTIGEQLTEALLVHFDISEEEAWTRGTEMLREAGIPEPEQRMEQYPHELSGGMKQRAMIAMGLICNPELIIADEPTTALDVTVQAQILELLKDLQKKHNTSVLLITHDLAVVAQTCDRVYVMYASKIVEEAPVGSLFEYALHPYTKGLFACIPRVDSKGEELYVIKGNVPDPSSFPDGCKFHPRCPFAKDICEKEEPGLISYGENHKCACHFAGEIK
jgi:oligopeptide/dipeptide ABC transporter ATP-binding protein